MAIELLPKHHAEALAVTAGQTTSVSFSLPEGANIKELRVVPNGAQAQSGTATNHLVITIDVNGTTVGTITNNSGQTNSYNPPRLITAYTANEPVELDFERRPGIDYTLVEKGDRAEVAKVMEFNRFINKPLNGVVTVAAAAGSGVTAITQLAVMVRYYDGGWNTADQVVSWP